MHAASIFRICNLLKECLMGKLDPDIKGIIVVVKTLVLN